jgi:hypothetical protein
LDLARFDRHAHCPHHRSVAGRRTEWRVERKVDEVVQRHAAQLIAIRASIFRYGTDLSDTQWDQEIVRFIYAQLAEMLDASKLAAVERHFRKIHSHVARRVGEIAAHQWVYH